MSLEEISPLRTFVVSCEKGWPPNPRESCIGEYEFQAKNKKQARKKLREIGWEVESARCGDRQRKYWYYTCFVCKDEDFDLGVDDK